MQREILTIPANELRFSADDDSGTFEGYAAIFSEPIPSYSELVLPGAFTRTLGEHRSRNSKPGMFWNHNSDEPIGVWTSLEQDSRGLKVAGRLVTGTTRGREAFELMKASAVSGLSIGFRTVKARKGANGLRELEDVDLVEISLTSIPAAANARITSFRNAAPPAATAAFVEAVRRAANALTKGNRDAT